MTGRLWCCCRRCPPCAPSSGTPDAVHGHLEGAAQPTSHRFGQGLLDLVLVVFTQRNQFQCHLHFSYILHSTFNGVVRFGYYASVITGAGHI